MRLHVGADNIHYFRRSLRQTGRNHLKPRTGRAIRIGLILNVFLMLFTTDLSAEYTLNASVMGCGGGVAAGGGYGMTATAGQGVIGVSDGSSFRTSHGFWHGPDAGGLLNPMLLIVSRLSSTTCEISWNPVSGATEYELYRSLLPYMDISELTPWEVVGAPETTLEINQGVGDVMTNYYFVGRARNSTQFSNASNAVGVFDFGPGEAESPLYGNGIDAIDAHQ